MTALISGKDLSMFRGDRCLFSAREFALAGGELLVIEGANGSGKTTLLRGIAGLLDFETGTIRWHDRPVNQCRQAFRANLGFLAHKTGLKADLNLVENLRFDAGLRATQDERFDAILERLDLESLRALPVRVLSAGQQRRVALARILLSAASLWMLDEPFTNLDRNGRGLVTELIAAHLDAGGIAIVASHQDVEVSAPVKRLALS